MKFEIYDLRSAMGATCVLAFGLCIAGAQETNRPPLPVDLPTALRLAGAQNLDIKIAREKLAEAKANQQSAIAQFFPWLAPGLSYRQHDDKIQDVSGNILEVHKYSYAPGAAINAQVDIGDAIYKTLAAKQLARAAGHAVEAQQQDAVLAAAQGYFELAFAQTVVGVAQESVKISAGYESQIQNAVETGLAFKGDALRVRVQTERNRIALRQAAEKRRVAAARLSQVLHLDPLVELIAEDAGLVPLDLIFTNTALDSLVQRTLAGRPELKQGEALASAAREARNGATYGPWIPSLGAQAFFGGLGGGKRGIGDSFGPQEDYLIGLNWRIGPGGLFDFTRINSSKSRLKVAELNVEKLRDDLTRQVIEAFVHWQSLADQLAGAKRVLVAAEEGLRLAQQRKEFAVGIVLETVQAEQDLTRARSDYAKAVAEFNKAQYELQKNLGGWSDAPAREPRR